jgi:hypothetical protein
MNTKPIKCFLLLLLITGCSHSTSPSNSSLLPGVGSSYIIALTSTMNSQSSTDTLVYSVDAINLQFMGRNAVSRLIRSIDNQTQDTLYINYLSSGDIEAYLQDFYAGPSPWLHYPFATQQQSSTILDTTWSFGPQIHSLFDTTSFTPDASGTQSIQGSTLADERVNVAVGVVSEGEVGSSHGVYSYIPSIGFFGFAIDTTLNSGQISLISQQILSYNLK